jgi:mycoredoxin-dependent peroxiredoxin
MALPVGLTAPDFTLHDQDRNPVSLADFRGERAVVLVFFPFAFTGTCQGELCSIRDQLPDFDNEDVVTLAVSTDSTASLKAWAEQQGFTFRLLSDAWPHGEVAQAYDVFNEHVGVAERGTFVIDRDGMIVHAVHHGIGDARDDTDYLAALADIGVT